jgi:DNA-binding FadR family transcriptional regulator
MAWQEPKTDWTESDPVGMADMDRIEENTVFLFEQARNAKQYIAAALIFMNRSASTESTFEQLAAAIEDISKDATATPADVVSGETFYAGGEKKIGTATGEDLS